MHYSYTRISTFRQCPRRYYYQYVAKLKTIPSQDADNALLIGNALHLGIEKNAKAMKESYLSQYYLVTDDHVNELTKLEMLLPKVKDLLSIEEKVQHEYQIDTDAFKGVVDLIIHNADGTVDIFDFKYSNNVDSYLESGQLHIYKHYLEQAGFHVRDMGYIFIPKTAIRQRKDESVIQFRRRLESTSKNMNIQLVHVAYDQSKVNDFFQTIETMNQAVDYPKQESKLCDFCPYKNYCMEGLDYMLLPKNERRNVTINTTPDMWLYGPSYSGKTVFMDSFDDVLMINTDGNVDHISSPVVRIIDTVKVEGRLTTRIYAWKNFLDVITELEKRDNEFKTVVVDLTEDLYEHCRLYMYDKLNIEHESDANYGKGHDMVRTEFLSNMKRLKNCGYQLVYLSKDATNEVTMKNGQKITTIKPNISDKIANVLAGTVDLTAHIVADGNERYLSFKSSPYIFGGSRYNFGVEQVELNRDAFLKLLKETQTKGSTDYKSERNSVGQSVNPSVNQSDNQSASTPLDSNEWSAPEAIVTTLEVESTRRRARV